MAHSRNVLQWYFGTREDGPSERPSDLPLHRWAELVPFGYKEFEQFTNEKGVGIRMRVDAKAGLLIPYNGRLVDKTTMMNRSKRAKGNDTHILPIDKISGDDPDEFVDANPKLFTDAEKRMLAGGLINEASPDEMYNCMFQRFKKGSHEYRTMPHYPFTDCYNGKDYVHCVEIMIDVKSGDELLVFYNETGHKRLYPKAHGLRNRAPAFGKHYATYTRSKSLFGFDYEEEQQLQRDAIESERQKEENLEERREAQREIARENVRKATESRTLKRMEAEKRRRKNIENLRK
jgi:hypothetical protein